MYILVVEGVVTFHSDKKSLFDWIDTIQPMKCSYKKINASTFTMTLYENNPMALIEVDGMKLHLRPDQRANFFKAAKARYIGVEPVNCTEDSMDWVYSYEQ